MFFRRIFFRGSLAWATSPLRLPRSSAPSGGAERTGMDAQSEEQSDGVPRRRRGLTAPDIGIFHNWQVEDEMSSSDEDEDDNTGHDDDCPMASPCRARVPVTQDRFPPDPVTALPRRCQLMSVSPWPEPLSASVGHRGNHQRQKEQRPRPHPRPTPWPRSPRV